MPTYLTCYHCDATSKACCHASLGLPCVDSPDCQLNSCSYCQNGKIICEDPPYGPALADYSDDLLLLSNEDFNHIIDYDIRNIHQQIEYVPVYLNFPHSLSEEELNNFKKYWDSPHRSENLGEVLNRVAWLVLSKNR